MGRKKKKQRFGQSNTKKLKKKKKTFTNAARNVSDVVHMQAVRDVLLALAAI